MLKTSVLHQEDKKQLFKARPKNENRALKRLMEQPPRPETLEFKRKRREFIEQVDRENAMMSRAFVGNLPHGVSPATLARIFKVCGPVLRVDISCFTYAPGSTCFAEVIFNEPNACNEALHLDGLLFEGLRLAVRQKLGEIPEVRPSRRKPRKPREIDSVANKTKI